MQISVTYRNIAPTSIAVGRHHTGALNN